MNWHDHICSDPSVLVGKPVIRGTRLSVDFLLGLMAEGWTQERLLENYPQLHPQALQAMYAFAAECTRDERIHVMGGEVG
ncbi:MAG: DUF433 domain-containing protein [Gammaproteobacteria bacterium]|nr:DUF433 domain-containing protein [Gammaproteobacteria bacterium]